MVFAHTRIHTHTCTFTGFENGPAHCPPSQVAKHHRVHQQNHANGSSGADLGSGIACWRMSASSVVRSSRTGRSLVSVSEAM